MPWPAVLTIIDSIYDHFYTDHGPGNLRGLKEIYEKKKMQDLIKVCIFIIDILTLSITPLNCGSMSHLTHSQQVCRLYRGALKMSLDWLIDRGKWRAFALALRQEFDARKSLSDPREKEEILLAGKHLLYKYRHPEPYICNY